MPDPGSTRSFAIFQHEFSKKLDEHATNVDGLGDLRRLFDRDSPDTNAILEYFVEAKIITPELAVVIRRIWVPENGRGDYGEIEAKTQDAFRQAFALTRPGQIPLTTRFVMGTRDFDILVHRARREVLMLILLPMLKKEDIAAKIVNATDPSFANHIKDAVAHLQSLLP